MTNENRITVLKAIGVGTLALIIILFIAKTWVPEEQQKLVAFIGGQGVILGLIIFVIKEKIKKG